MTAEVIVMNKGAVALAADSAVTISGGASAKIFKTASKLFALSRPHPVGIMVYGNADLMGIPWETIIKLYRTQLGSRSFQTVKEYADDFVTFLKNNTKLLSAEQQRTYVKTMVGYLLGEYLIAKVREDVLGRAKAGNPTTDADVPSILSGVIQREYDRFAKHKMLPTIPPHFQQMLAERYGKEIQEAISGAFQKLPLTGELRNKVTEIALGLFCREGLVPFASGLVIAGFGEGELFPCAIDFEVACVVADTLVLGAQNCSGITFDCPSMVKPYAQADEVATFMEGIAPDLKRFIKSYLRQILQGLPETIGRVLAPDAPGKRSQLVAGLLSEATKVGGEFDREFERFVEANHVEPVVAAVGVLPKDELAAMAEALVSLTSFKRRVSMAMETVGGPIDVAVISKGDGFIWIRRKHYFRPELNPGYFAGIGRLVQGFGEKGSMREGKGDDHGE